MCLFEALTMCPSPAKESILSVDLAYFSRNFCCNLLGVMNSARLTEVSLVKGIAGCLIIAEIQYRKPSW